MKRTSLRNRKANVPTLNSKRLDGISEKSGGLLKTALDCSGQIIFITDPNGVFQYVNPEFMKTYGYEPSEVVGKVTPRILQSGQMSSEFYEEFWHSIIAGNVFKRRLKNKTKQGQVLDIEISVNPIIDGAKEIVGFLAIQKDVTLELSGYRKLLESEEQFRTLVNSMDDIVFTLDNEFKYTGVYGTWMSKAGFSPGQFLGKTAVEIFGEEEGNLHHEQARKAFGGRSTIYEWSYLNGLERRFVQTSLSPLYGGNGRPHALVGLGRDVTRMKRVEQEQATALLRQRLLLDSVAEGIFTLDAQGRCTLINKTAIELLGWSEEELLGRDIHVLIHHLQQDGKPSKEKECHVLGALRTGQSYRDIEDVFWKKDGRWFDVEFNAEPIEMNGTMVGTVVSFSDLSEHKRDEQLLRESVQQYRALMDGASDAIAIVDLTTEIILEVNKSAEKLLGSNRLNLVGKRFIDLYPPEHQAAARQAFSRVVEAGEASKPLETFVWNSAGYAIPVEVTSNILDLKGARILQLVCRDTTERKQMEEALLYEQGLLRAIMDNMPDHVYFKDKQSRFLKMSRSQANRFGLDNPVQAVGKTDFDFFAEAHARPAFEDEKRIMETGIAIVDVEEKESWPDGQETWVSTTKAPLQNTQGEIIGTFGISRDITERKRIEKELLQRTSLFEQLFEASPVAIAFLDNESHISDVNASFKNIFGYDKQECLGKDLATLIVPDLRIQESKDVEALVNEGIPFQRETIRKSKDGTLIDVLLLGFPVTSESGRVGSYVMYSDLREQKKIEGQFLRAQRMESIGVLAGGISHDLNNVLGPILLSLELLKRRFTDEQSQKLLTSIESSAMRGAGIVKQILSFARGAEGERSPLSLKHVINEMKNIIKETFPVGIQLQTSVAKDLWLVDGDATQLHQVLMNLCVNARDAMPGGGLLSISAENAAIDEAYAQMQPLARAGRHVVLKVSDRGMGIPSEVQERIFDPFFTTKEKGKGTGLGLSTVMGIVKGHGGFIDLSSKEREGTTFSIYLPASEGSVDSSKGAESMELQGKGEKILIADDEESIVYVTKDALELYNYTVLRANDGVAAVEIVASHHGEIDLAVIDMMMPFMDGSLTIRTMRKLNPHIKILAVSGMNFDENELMQRLSIQGFMQKPFTSHALLGKIRKILDASGTASYEDNSPLRQAIAPEGVPLPKA